MRKPFAQFTAVDRFTLSIFRSINSQASAGFINIPANLPAGVHKPPLKKA